MKKIVVSVLAGVVMTFVLLRGSVSGQTPAPPPPPPPSFIPPTIALPPSIFSTPTPTNTATPTSTPTATATSTPVPLHLNLRLKYHTLAPGKRQTATVRTLAGARVQYIVQFPNKRKLTHTTTAPSSGKLSWSYTQPQNTTTAKSRTASVRVNVTLAGQHNTSRKTYSIGPGR